MYIIMNSKISKNYYHISSFFDTKIYIIYLSINFIKKEKKMLFSISFSRIYSNKELISCKYLSIFSKDSEFKDPFPRNITFCFFIAVKNS